MQDKMCIRDRWNQMSDRDIDYVKEMYPVAFMTIQDWVERECDKQEFAGSLMFDEYPDKLGVLQMVNNIFRQIKEEEEQCGDGENCIKYPDDQWLSLIHILQEKQNFHLLFTVEMLQKIHTM